MPEAIRLKVGGVTPQQMTVYEEFARNIPGFLPLTERDAALFIHKPAVALEQQQQQQQQSQIAAAFQTPQPVQASDELTGVYEKLAVEVEQFIQATAGQPSFNVMNSNMHILHECLMHASGNRDFVMSAMTLVQKVSTKYAVALVQNKNVKYPWKIRDALNRITLIQILLPKSNFYLKYL